MRGKRRGVCWIAMGELEDIDMLMDGLGAVHQEGLSMNEKILRHFDLSSQYGVRASYYCYYSSWFGKVSILNYISHVSALRA